jgi:hypothetical protein
MSWIPGWDSIASAQWWESFYFWIGIGALILLGVAEIVSHQYSGRKDELTAIEQHRTQRQHDKDMAALHLEAAQANERAARLEKEAAELRLATEQLHQLSAIKVIRVLNNRQFVDIMSAFKNVAVDIFARGDADGIDPIAQALRMTLWGAKWDVTVFSENTKESAFRSVQIWVRDGSAPSVRDAALALAEVFRSAEAAAMVSFGSGGTLIDWASPLRLPSGKMRDASKNAPMRIFVGNATPR